jgi:hypothetical protein
VVVSKFASSMPSPASASAQRIASDEKSFTACVCEVNECVACVGWGGGGRGSDVCCSQSLHWMCVLEGGGEWW